MKKKFLPGILALIAVGPVDARIWTDVKGRKIDAEYVSQTDDAVVLRLKSQKEVTVPFTKLSRDDLSYLIELETSEAKKDGVGEKDGADDSKPAGVAPEKLAPDPAWDRPVPREAVLTEPLQIEELKKEESTHYSSANYRIVADGRLSDKAVKAMLEAAELTKIYCESLPFGMVNRYAPVEGKYEIHTYGEEDDWVKAGGNRGLPAIADQESGKLKLCLESLGLNSSGRGGEDRMRYLAGQLILHVSRSMIPEIYRRNLKDWFNEGLPNLLNCGVYEKGRLDFSEIATESRDLLLGKSRSGQKAIFKKQIQMLKMDDLVGQTVAGPADMDERRRFLGQCVLLMGYLVFLEDDGKATGLRDGLRYASDFQKNNPNRITYSTQEELERKKAELIQKRRDMGEITVKKVFRERPWAEVEKDIAARWEVHGLKLEFGKGAAE